MHSTARFLFLCLVALTFSPSFCVGGARHFTFLYEATTSAPGSIELENWVTFRTGNQDGERFSEFDFRHEFEFGITNQFQLSVYVADWRYQTGFADQASGFAYSGSAVEAIYNLTNPVIDPVGISIYEEVKVGDWFVESESKLIAQKNFGPLIIAYNATLEATWEGSSLQEEEGEFQQALGASYELSPNFSAGIEMLHEFIFPEWRAKEHTQNFFIGPNLSVRSGRWFATITALAQATQTADEPDCQVRTIFGFGF
jgi:hypothetical protein